ncbi:MAG: tRNA pseudouridine(55) synthase TruB [Myxococcota bacterium]
MARKTRASRERSGPAGFLVVDKPAGWTSHDVVDAARRWFGTRRVGHLGTLDPQATGVLPLAIRQATKLVRFVVQDEKHYVGTVRLGLETDSLDGEGKLVRVHDGPLPDSASIRSALTGFAGDIEQIPPMYSAVKHGGVPLHRLARRGEEVVRGPKKVRIHRIEMIRFDPPNLEIAVACSPGTYVRSLAADLGTRLGCGAYLSSLRRVRSGPFDECQAHSPDVLASASEAGEPSRWLIPATEVLDLPTWTLPESAAARVLHGGDLPADPRRRETSGSRMLALTADGRLLAVLELKADRHWWPLRVLAQEGA